MKREGGGEKSAKSNVMNMVLDANYKCDSCLMRDHE